MKKYFAILAMICMVALAVPAMAIDMDDDGEQFQGGINVYIENGAATIGDLAAGSANIVAGQLSFQAQRNETDINFCNKEEVYFQEQDNYYNSYDYDYARYESPMEGTYELKGQTQEWFQANRFSTGYGQAEMIQQGYQSGMSANFTQVPTQDMSKVEAPDNFFDDNYDEVPR